jgi:hypothetical protein
VRPSQRASTEIGIVAEGPSYSLSGLSLATVPRAATSQDNIHPPRIKPQASRIVYPVTIDPGVQVQNTVKVTGFDR